MLFVNAILGGLLIMMGQHSRSEALFYYFRLEDQVPETHLLRLIYPPHHLLRPDYNISNDVGRVKGHGLLFLSFADTRFASAQTHWFLSRVTTLLLR